MNPKQLIIALAAACLAALPAAANAQVRPSVPLGLDVPAGHKVFFVGQAVGTQNYVCVGMPSGAAVWIPFGPQATLFEDGDVQATTHYLSANPDEVDTLRPTWQHSRDTSTVWAEPIASSQDAAYVEPGAIPWLLLRVRGARRGPTGGGRLTPTTYIQRVYTSGGATPTSSCASGDKKLVPYTTDYYFYKAS